MKRIALLLLIAPISAFCQTDKDYDQAMSKFMKFYNTNKGDSINAMFGSDWNDAKMKMAMWNDSKNAELIDKYGTLKSVKYIGVDNTDPEMVHVYRTVFSKAGTKTTSLTLDSDHKLGTFRFITTSDGIKELMKKAR